MRKSYNLLINTATVQETQSLLFHMGWRAVWCWSFRAQGFCLSILLHYCIWKNKVVSKMELSHKGTMFLWTLRIFELNLSGTCLHNITENIIQTCVLHFQEKGTPKPGKQLTIWPTVDWFVKHNVIRRLNECMLCPWVFQSAYSFHLSYGVVYKKH